MRSIAAIIVGLTLAATSVAAQNGKMSWNFDTDKIGEIAKGFTNEVGKWEVAPDDTAPSKPNVLAQLAKSSGPTFNVTLVKDTNYNLSQFLGAGQTPFPLSGVMLHAGVLALLSPGS
jgi:hypothetical protein